MFITGTNGTFAAATRARFANKPILGIGTFGGSGRELYNSEKEPYVNNYTYLLSGDLKYEMLYVLEASSEDVDILAKNTISICDNLMRSGKVFTIMSFKDEYKDVYEIFLINMYDI